MKTENLRWPCLYFVASQCLSLFFGLQDLPFELIQYEIVNRLGFNNIFRFGATCKEYQQGWKRWVKSLPYSVLERCDDKRLSSFTSLTTLDLGDNKNITDSGLAPLTSLTTLNLGSNNNITDSGLAPLTSLTILYFDYNKNITDSCLVLSHFANNPLILDITRTLPTLA